MLLLLGTESNRVLRILHAKQPVFNCAKKCLRAGLVIWKLLIHQTHCKSKAAHSG